MPRFRFTVRRMMLAVAIVAVLCAGEIMRQRRVACLELGRACELNEKEYLKLVEFWGKVARGEEPVPDGYPGDPPTDAAWCRYFARKYCRDRLKYERAARSPWLRVEPDPPEPE
jgi:hypothetical protein